MPIKIYPPVAIRNYVTASRRVFAGACTTAGSSSIGETLSLLHNIEISTATGWEIPGWHKMKNAGRILPFTKWDVFRLKGEAFPAHREFCLTPSGTRQRWENYYRNGSWLDKDQGTLMGLVDPFDLEYLVQKAAAAIHSKSFDALTFIAEIGQLRRMFLGIVKKFDSLTKGKSPGELHNLWLEGRYGWRILIYDIKELHQLLSQTNERRTRYRESKGISVSGSWNDYSMSTSNNITTGISSDISWTGNLRGTVVADIDIPDFAFNPVTTVWEVVRLSFVIDWLFNVGQALEAASFLLMAKTYKAGAGYRFDFDLSQTMSHVGTSGTTICHANDGSCAGHAVVISRLPKLVSGLPRTKLRLDEWKVLDLLSLIMQRLR